MKTEYYNVSGIGLSNPELTKNNFMFDNTLLEALPISEGVRREMLLEKELIRKYHIKQRTSDGRWYAKKNGKQIFRKNYNDIIMAVQESCSISGIWNEFLIYRSQIKNAETVRKDVRNYEIYIQNSELAKMPFSSINTITLHQFLNHCIEVHGERFKRKYWSGIMLTVSQVCEYAHAKTMIPANPCLGIKFENNLFTAPTIHNPEELYFNDEEVEQILELTQKIAVQKNDIFYYGIVLFLKTALRIGEINALKWGDIHGDWLHIRRTMSGGKDQVKDVPKTKYGVRKVPLVEASFSVLEKIKHLNEINGLPVSDDDYIFLEKKKNKIIKATNRYFEARIKTLQNPDNLDYEVARSAHDMRRTVATILYRNGTDLKTLMMILGHSSIKQTMVYIQPCCADNVMEAFKNAL